MAYDVDGVKIGSILVNRPYNQYFYVFDIKNVGGLRRLYMHGVDLMNGQLFNTSYYCWNVSDIANERELIEFYDYLKTHQLTIDLNLKTIRKEYNFNT